MNKIQEIIKNIEFEINLYKNDALILTELNSLLKAINKFSISPSEITLNDFINANIRAYDVLMNDNTITAKQKRAYNFMSNFLVSNK